MLRNVLTVGGWTMASRILGFARDVLIAATLGAGPIADAFFVALKLPNLFRRLFGEGAFNAAFVPTLSGALATEGKAFAQELAEHMVTLMTLWLSLLVGLGLCFMPQLVGFLAHGFAAEPERFGLAVEMGRITFPYLLFVCLAALISGVLNSLGRFAAAAAAPVAFNLLSMAALYGLASHVPTPGHALAWGVTISGVVQLVLLWLACARAGMPLRPRMPRFTPEVRRVLTRMVPGLFGAGVTQLNLTIDVLISSLLPLGAVSFLYYADRISQLPLGIVGAAVGTALLPVLSRQVRAGQRLQAHRTTNRAIELSLALTLPAATGLAVAAHPIVQTLFARGAFDATQASATADALAAYAFGLPAYVLVKVFAPGFFARGDTATPVKVGLAAVALNLSLNTLLMAPLAHVGVALSTAVAAWFNAGGVAILLARRGHFRLDHRLRRALPRLVLAAIVMGLALHGLDPVFFPAESGVGRFAALGALVSLGALAYFVVACACGAFNVREAVTILRRKRQAPLDASVPAEDGQQAVT